MCNAIRERTMTAKTSPRALLLCLSMVSAVAAPPVATAGGLTVGSGALIVEELPVETLEDLPVCADSSTGKLGRCSAGGTGGGDIGRIAWVAGDGSGDYLDPVTAMDDLATWCGTPAYANPCLLRIAPGVYNLDQALEMVDWVTVEGSGVERTTLLRTNNDSSTTGTVASFTIDEHAALQHLSIRAKDGNANVGLKVNHGSGLLVVRDVFIRSSGAAAISGDNIGILMTSGHAVLDDVEILAVGLGSGTGIRVDTTSVLESDRVRIRAQSSGASAIGIEGNDAATILAENTEIEVSQSLAPSGNNAFGVSLESGDFGRVLFSGLRIEVDPDNVGYGVYLVDVSDPGPPIVPRIRNAIVEVSDTGSASYGVFTTAGADVRIAGSTIRASDSALRSASAGSTQMVAYTLLDGGAVGSASDFNCTSVATYATLASLDSSCQSGL
jgi:hypothetical protein